jgi:hypothetical protein
MRPFFENFDIQQILSSYMPDLVLAFTFFTALSYAVLGKKIDKQRAAIAASAAIGFALSIGLVGWETTNDISIKDLGPIAVGFAIIFIAFVMYHAIKNVGGSWAGAGITFGACVFIAQLLKLNMLLDPNLLQAIMAITLLVGILTFLSHTQRNRSFLSNIIPSRSIAPPNMTRLYRERHLSKNIEKNMWHLRKESSLLHEHPRDAENIILQIQRMLPAEGYLMEKMAQLRDKAHRVKNGHIARLEETQQIFANLPIDIKKKASQQLIARYRQLIDFDAKLEQLDKAAAENERAIRQLTAESKDAAAHMNYQKLAHTLEAAQKLQRRNSSLFKVIDRTEQTLTALAKKTADEVNKNAAPH